MRRVMLIPLAAAAVLAGAINTRTTATEDGSEEAEDAFEVQMVASLQAAATTTTEPSTTTTTASPPPPPTTTTTAPPPPPPPPTTTTTTAPPPPAIDPAAGIVCPVQGDVSFIDSWGYARSGGRTHEGVDMMAATGTPTVAPVSGTVEHSESSLGGLSWYVQGDDGNTYYGAHLSGFGADGYVTAGTVIGYVGASGNASGGAPHLHFEIHPGGGEPVNPYPQTAEACF